MPAQVLSSVENNFTKGLITEFTGMNFPENAATDTENCIYTIVGDVTRRNGIDYETNFSLKTLSSRTNAAISSYKWNNVSGDGLTQIVVEQIGTTLYFYTSSSASASAPLSTTLLASNVNLVAYTAGGGNFDSSKECTYADGNGYLFVYHPSMDPIYCAYNAVTTTITPTVINLQIRDFTGVNDGLSSNVRPSSLGTPHQYNLQNQGWVSGSPWYSTSSDSITMATFTTGSHSFNIGTVTGINNGDAVTSSILFHASAGFLQPNFPDLTGYFSGSVTAYAAPNITINVTSISFPNNPYNGNQSLYASSGSYAIVPTSIGNISTWFGAVGNYPSNSDVWWYYKNTSGVFAPGTTYANVTSNLGYAPRGHYVLNAFGQFRSIASSTSGLTDVVTTARPRVGTWFQGRVWYAGVDATQAATGTANAYSWTENIYYSQIVNDPSQFGSCYQVNDPTSQTLFGLLPTDGGVVQIQGCGPIYKLFALQNALLIFAANGVWYLSGSQGIGFSANDFTIVKLSSIRSISSTSFIDINGLPMFWNEEGIYQVEPAKQGTSLLNSPLHVNPLEVNPVTVGTILSFYNAIPKQSKKYARGSYHPIDYVVQWCYRSTNESNVTDRYQFDTILNFNHYNKAFYPYTVTGTPYIHNIRYIESPGGTGAPDPAFKYFTSQLVGGAYTYTFSDEHDTSFVDWKSFDTVGVNYSSYFITGFKLHGQGQRRFQIPYLYVYNRLNNEANAYKIQSLWDYANTRNSNRWSVAQLININSPDFDVIARRHRLRGQGLVLQFKVSSVDGLPFDVIGWSAFETQNAGV